jgi:NADPH2:quinone reductase
MLAVRCLAYGAAPVVKEVPAPIPGAGEVLVDVHAAAVNLPDLLIIANRYQLTVDVPFTVGSEFAGLVVAAGAGVDPSWVGRPVAGAVLVGAFAEQVAVPVASLHPVPDGLDLSEAAAFFVTYATAFHALRTIGGAQEGDWVAVLGAAGGVGSAAVDIAAALGMRVIAAAGGPHRVSVALSRGATAGVDYTTEDLKIRVKQLTGTGADVIVDPVGGDQAEAAMRAIRWGGRFVTVGFASGVIPRIPLNIVLLKGAVVRGFEIRTIEQHVPGARAMADAELAALVRAGMRPLLAEVLPLHRAPDALGLLADRKAVGKVVLRVR